MSQLRSAPALEREPTIIERMCHTASVLRRRSDRVRGARRTIGQNLDRTIEAFADLGRLMTTQYTGRVLLEDGLGGEAGALAAISDLDSDVRDVAAAHVLPMTAPAAAGKQFIASGDVLWYSEVAN